MRTLTLNGRLVVTWRRAGDTCVLSGSGIKAAGVADACGVEGPGGAPLRRVPATSVRRHPLARAVQAGGDRRLADAQRAGRLAVGQPDDVDRDQRVAEVVG